MFLRLCSQIKYTAIHTHTHTHTHTPIISLSLSLSKYIYTHIVLIYYKTILQVSSKKTVSYLTPNSFVFYCTNNLQFKNETVERLEFLHYK
jgi:hypothetical protein